ncbi:reverse transcriptase (RNA-dependent DNA polymerase) [Hirsutella rhossiliensis]
MTSQALEYLHTHGDSYEPGTEMPRAYQRAAAADDSDDELAGETQGTIHCYQATQPATQWTSQRTSQRVTMPSNRREEEDIEDEDDPLADFDEMERRVDEEARARRVLDTDDPL